MAETETVPQDAPAKKRLPIKLVVIALVVLLALAGAYVFVLSPGGEGEEAEPPAPEFSEDGGETLVVDAGTTLSIAGERRYAMVTYSVRPSIDVADTSVVEMEFARMRSQVQRVLLGHQAEALLTPEGVAALEADIAGVADEIWPDGEIVAVYLENIVVQ